MYQQYFKRLFDLALVLVTIPITLPAFLLTAGWLAVFQRGKIFFKQVRPGQYGKYFTLYKFRTMQPTCAPDGTLLPDAVRLTRLGQIIRKYSLDELPQLWNVIRGDISLVGPRPLLPEYLNIYTLEQARRHLVKPGITGWAQINGRNSLTWEEKFAFDIWYVAHQSFLIDLKIILLTLLKLFKPSGIQAPGSATAERFNGTNPHAT